MIGEEPFPQKSDDEGIKSEFITQCVGLSAIKTQVESYAELVSKTLLKSQVAATSKYNVG